MNKWLTTIKHRQIQRPLVITHYTTELIAKQPDGHYNL